MSLRLATFVLISGIVIYWMRYPEFLSFPYFAYSLLTLMLPALFVLRKYYDIGFLIKAIPLIQILFEIIIEVGIIYVTGNVNSTFSALFILTIISAALVTNLAGTLMVASAVSLSYAFVVWFGLAAGHDPSPANQAVAILLSTEDAVFYNIFLHILIFFLTAFVSGFLVERLKSKDRELADTSQALRKAKLETDDILRHLNSGLFTIDREGRIVFFNRTAEEILGYHEIEVRGRDFREVFHERSVQMADNLIRVLETEKDNLRTDVNVLNRNGRSIPVGVSTSILRDDDGSIRGVIAIFQDLTETKRLEEKIRAADKMAAVGELSAAIAHEIRNPLAAISGSVEVLKGELAVADEDRRLLELIVKESSRLNDILSDFLLFARSHRTAFVRIELCRLVSDVIDIVKHHPSYRPDHQLKITALESVVYVYSDENQLKQILINLIVNACEAIDKYDGVVEAVIESITDDEVRLTITDNGPGIHDDIISKVFTPFFSTKKAGTGLGLAIVQRLASNLQINLACRSEMGRGTTFILGFSRIAEKSSEESSPSEIRSSAAVNA